MLPPHRSRRGADATRYARPIVRLVDPDRIARRGLPLLLALDAGLLVAGLTLPAVRTERPLSTGGHSIVGGVLELFRAGQVVLGAVVLCFSVLFPIAKLVALALITRSRVRDERRHTARLVVLGKWSMLDVFVVVLFVGAVQLGLLADFRPRVGIHLFAASILATMVTTHLVARREGGPEPLRPTSGTDLRSWPWRVVSTAAVAAFAVGLWLPLMTVEKWVFWSDRESVLGALAALAAEGRPGLFTFLALFVVALPAVRLIGLSVVRWLPNVRPGLLRALLALEAWSMLDVFAVALLVVIGQLSRRTAITAHEGLAWLLAAALLSALDARQFRRTLVADPRTSRGAPAAR